MSIKITLFQGIFLGVFGLAAVIGLFVFATYSNNGASETVGTVVIWGTLPAAQMKEVLSLSTQTVPDLKGVSYVEKSEATLSNDLASAIATGVAPDLVLASQEDLLAIRKFISPIPTSVLPKTTFTDAFTREGTLLTAPDGYWGVPFLIDPLVMFVNRAMTASSGIAKPPATWESLVGLVPHVTTLTPAKQITRGLIALGSYKNVHNARGILSTLFLQAGSPISTSASGGGIAANLGDIMGFGGGEPIGQAVLGFYTQFADPLKVSYTWNASLKDSRQMFLAGDLALYLGYASEARFFSVANPNLSFAAVEIPQPANSSTKKTYGLVYSFMIPNGAGNSSGAFQAAALLTGADTQDAAARAAGLAPASLNALARVPTDDPALAIAYTSALYADGWLSPAPSDTDEIFSNMINDVVSGRVSIPMALSSAARALTVQLQK